LPTVKAENVKIAVELYTISGRIILRDYIDLKGEELSWLLGNKIGFCKFPDYNEISTPRKSIKTRRIIVSLI
jgi:hypothetical protein